MAQLMLQCFQWAQVQFDIQLFIFLRSLQIKKVIVLFIKGLDSCSTTTSTTPSTPSTTCGKEVETFGGFLYCHHLKTSYQKRKV